MAHTLSSHMERVNTPCNVHLLSWWVGAWLGAKRLWACLAHLLSGEHRWPGLWTPGVWQAPIRPASPYLPAVWVPTAPCCLDSAHCPFLPNPTPRKPRLDPPLSPSSWGSLPASQGSSFVPTGPCDSPLPLCPLAHLQLLVLAQWSKQGMGTHLLPWPRHPHSCQWQWQVGFHSLPASPGAAGGMVWGSGRDVWGEP